MRIPAIMIRFDDSYTEHYTICYAYMRPHNLRATCYAITGSVGGGGSLTWAQAQEMNAAGWAIGNHTRAHTNLLGLTVLQQQTAINNGITDLVVNGLPRCSKYLGYPFGAYDANTLIADVNLGILTGQSTEATINGVTGDPSGYIPQVLPDYFQNNNLIIRNVVHSNLTPLAVAKTIVDTSIAGGLILSPLFHLIGGAGDMSVVDFRAYIDYVIVKIKAGLLQAITIDDYYKLTLGPVRVPRII